MREQTDGCLSRNLFGIPAFRAAAPQRPAALANAFPVASRPIGACPRSLRSGLISGDRAAIRFEALFENVLVSTKARRNEEMLLRFGK